MKKILYSDSNGRARFVDYSPGLEVINERLSLSSVLSAEGFQFRHSPAGIKNPWHCTKVDSTQWVIITAGEMIVGLRDGSATTFLPGDMFLSMDIQSSEQFEDHEGHFSASGNNSPLETVFVKVAYPKCQEILSATRG